MGLSIRERREQREVDGGERREDRREERTGQDRTGQERRGEGREEGVKALRWWWLPGAGRQAGV